MKAATWVVLLLLRFAVVYSLGIMFIAGFGLLKHNEWYAIGIVAGVVLSVWEAMSQ